MWPYISMDAASKRSVVLAAPISCMACLFAVPLAKFFFANARISTAPFSAQTLFPPMRQLAILSNPAVPLCAYRYFHGCSFILLAAHEVASKRCSTVSSEMALSANDRALHRFEISSDMGYFVSGVLGFFMLVFKSGSNIYKYNKCMYIYNYNSLLFEE